MNFFEFWFFCWVTKSTYYERLRRFLRLLKKVGLQLQLYVKWKSYAIGESSFDKLCKNCRHSHKNHFFCVLIFLLNHKFVILLPPKRIWSYSKKWACSATLKITVFFIFAIVNAHGQQYPIPCSKWSAEEVEWEQGSGPKGPMSCRTQGWISIRPERAYLRP